VSADGKEKQERFRDMRLLERGRWK